MTPTGTNPTGEEAARRPRMTIGRGMIAVALVAVVLGLGRKVGYGPGLVIGLSVGAGWLAWEIGRWRPQAALPGLGGVSALGSGVMIAIPLVLGRGDFVLAFMLTAAPVLTLAYPTILGFSLSWLAHARATAGAGWDEVRAERVVVAIWLVSPVAALAARFWIGTMINGLAH